MKKKPCTFVGFENAQKHDNLAGYRGGPVPPGRCYGRNFYRYRSQGKMVMK
jgi:hypothetical protein